MYISTTCCMCRSPLPKRPGQVQRNNSNGSNGSQRNTSKPRSQL